MPSIENLGLKARLDINSQAKVFGGFANKNYKAAAWTLRQVGLRAYNQARENVAPGQGPGPHPHVWEHDDTENLWKSIGLKFDWSGGSRMNVLVYTIADYGVALEIGWRTPRNNFFRYPWLKPAYKIAGQGFVKIATDNWHREVFNVETGATVMTSGDIDVATGANAAALLKPLEGWKDYNPNQSGLTAEALTILTAGEIEPEAQPSTHGPRRRGKNTGRSLRQLALAANQSARGKGKKHAGPRHSAKADNRAISNAAAERNARRGSRKQTHPGATSLTGVRGGIRRLGGQAGREGRIRATQRRAQIGLRALSQRRRSRR